MSGIHDAPFVIFAQARTGSTMLRRALDAHEQICCHGELFMKKKVQGHSIHLPDLHWSEKPDALMVQREGDFAGFMQSLVFPPRPHWAAIGFKILDEQFFFDENHGRLTAFIREAPEMKLIFLHRENALERYVSRLIRRGRFEPSLRQALSVETFAAFHAEACERMTSIAQLFPDHRRAVLRYEDLAGDIETHISFLYGFLGAGPGSVKIEETKSSPRDLTCLIENHNELQAVTANAQFDFAAADDVASHLAGIDPAVPQTRAEQAFELGRQFAAR